MLCDRFVLCTLAKPLSIALIFYTFVFELTLSLPAGECTRRSWLYGECCNLATFELDVVMPGLLNDMVWMLTDPGCSAIWNLAGNTLKDMSPISTSCKPLIPKGHHCFLDVGKKQTQTMHCRDKDFKDKWTAIVAVMNEFRWNVQKWEIHENTKFCKISSDFFFCVCFLCILKKKTCLGVVMNKMLIALRHFGYHKSNKQ